MRRPVTYQGRTFESLKALATACGLPYPTLYSRLQTGWSVEASVETERVPHGSRGRAHRPAERELWVEAFARWPDAFTPRERAAVTAIFFEGRTLRDAAKVLGLTTVAGRLLAARARLRQLQTESALQRQPG